MSNSTRNMLRASNIVLWLGALAFAAGGFCQNYVPLIVVPHSPGNPAHQTFPYSINGNGVIAGYYTFGSGLLQSGFVRAADGTITSFSPLSSPGSPVLETLGFSINAAGAIAGYYVGGTAPFTNHGFVRDTGGNFTLFDPPGSTSTIVQSINDGGDITGYYYDASNVKHGFVRLDNGTLTSFDPSGSIATTAVSINANGIIAGYYQLADGSTHGFVRQVTRSIVPINAPANTGLTVTGLNNAGAITGYYTANGQTFGFVSDTNGNFTSFQAGFSTFPTSINASGAITGWYVDASGTAGHNFVRAPGGSITFFDPPSATPPGIFCGGPASVTSINDNGAIIGWCFTGVPNPSIIGFARFP